jgi:lipoprotein-anchoring transpeptidase ErfK/SrfK
MARPSDVTRYRLGFLGSWTLFVIAAGAIVLSVVGLGQNLRDARHLARLRKIDAMLAERLDPKLSEIRSSAAQREEKIAKLRTDVEKADVAIGGEEDTDTRIVVSTAENKLWLRRGKENVLQAVVSTGKGTTLVQNGREMKFETPTGRFRIISKEENPVWVPPDWHYIEEARKKGQSVVRLAAGEAIDADTGNVVPEKPSGGLFSVFSSGTKAPRRVLRVEGGQVVEVLADGTKRTLPPGETIRAGKAVVIPPVTTSQRRVEKVLGRYRLNIGNGYALHGTQATDQLGRSVSHGCVRVPDAELEKIFGIAKVGDQVLIY